MKKNTRILLSGILLILTSCKSEISTPELKIHFTEDQISDFNKITEFFIEQICENNKASDFEDCFKKILPELVNNGWSPILEKVDFEKQNEMYNSLSNETFKEIWSFQKSQQHSEETKYKSGGINTSGKYLEFLNVIGNRNNYVSNYVKEIYASGDVPSNASLQNHIYTNPNDLNLNDYNIQVLIAINYLTQNNGQKRAEK
ncbi:hypothetical protein [uncultured Aquimarina sp.]|uniref:hypothetical protein n=1 Tax=uncultured Aquimarina sp. TaxID=575652 RepID=UPI002604CB92|nr:hypothetical protein [uncultured Aquimarina sp.]